MIVRVSCPGCAAVRWTRPGSSCVWVRCVRCTATIFLPPPNDPALEKPPEPTRPSLQANPVNSFEEDEDLSNPFLRERWPMVYWVLLSIFWVALGWNIALLSAWWADLPSVLRWPLNVAPLLVTLWLIVVNLIRMVRTIAATGHTLSALPLTICQILLFLLLFFQIYAHIGTWNYAWDGTPTGLDWIAFTGAHAFRAADLFDVLQAFGWSLPVIHHASFLSGSAIIFFHIVVDLFVISLLAEWVQKLRRGAGPQDTRPQQRERMMWALAIVWLTAFVLWTTVIERWSTRDLILWPTDNVLRVVDFPDVMQIAGIRLHHVGTTHWVFVGVLSFVFRFLLIWKIAGALGRLLQRIRMRSMGGLGVSEQELRELAISDDPVVARRAQRMLERMECFSGFEVVIVMSPTAKRVAIVLGTLILVAGAVASYYIPLPSS